MHLASFSRLPLAAVIAVSSGSACGPRATSGTGAGPVVSTATVVGAARWVPAHPTYVVAAHAVRDVQRSLRDFADSFGAAGGGAHALSKALTDLLGVDALSADAVAAIGIDLDGGLALFSDELDPTFVIHIAVPESLAAFFDHLREHGLVTKSVVVDGTEVFTAKVDRHTHISWAVAGDWLWLHFGFSAEPTTTWFTSSHAASPAAWAADWAWATDHAPASAVSGLVRVHDLVDKLVAKVPEALACAHVIESIGRVGLTVDGDGRRVGGALAFDLGPAAAGLASHVVPVPEGWDAATANAAIGVQWNLDLDAVRATLQPCAAAIGFGDLRSLSTYGVRAGRAALLTFSPDAPSGTGVVALELASRTHIDGVLAQVLDLVPGPVRAMLDHGHRYGPYDGHELAIPRMVTLDYLVTDKLAFAAVGDGILDRVIGKGGTAPGALAALDVTPSAMPADAWRALLGYIPGARWLRDVIPTLMMWRDGHLALRIDHDRLVFEAHGDRR